VDSATLHGNTEYQPAINNMHLTCLPMTSAMYGQNFGTSIAMSSANSKNSFTLKQM
jgi:hypothetical protein